MSGRRRPPLTRILFILIFFAFFLPFSGCSVWDSLTAYFNTYYNASKLYEEAVTELWKQPELSRQGQDNFLAEVKVTPAIQTKLTSVIEKCSKLLQYHPESGLVDDALMMIGMSYFYMSDYPQAERKYREIISGYPDGNLALRAWMLLANTEFKLGRIDTAVALANQVTQMAEEEGDDAILGHAVMVLGMAEKERGNFPGAAEKIRLAAENAENASLKNVRYLALGVVYEKMREYVKAQEAYEEAADVSNNYVGEYRGFFGAASMRAAQEDYRGALNELERLRDNFNNKEFFGEIELEIGNVYRMRGDLESALEQYLFVDTAYVRTEIAARACIEMGKVYEYTLLNYDSARTVYVRAKTHYGAGSYIADVTWRIDYLTRYDLYTKDLKRLDSTKAALIVLASAPADSVELPQTAGVPADSLATKDSTAAVDSATVQPKTPAKSSVKAAPARPTQATIDSVDNRIALVEGELATLFYTTMALPDSAAFWYRLLLNDHPNSPVVPRALFTLAQISSEDSTAPPGQADSLYRDIIARFPLSVYANESRRLLGLPTQRVSVDEAEAAYARAEEFFLVGDTVRAIEAYQQVVQDYPKSQYAARAQYAVGWTYENLLMDADSAIVHYQALVSSYPTSPYVALVQPKLAEVQLERSKAAQAVADTSKPVVAAEPQKKPEAAVETAPRRDQGQAPSQMEKGAGRRSRKRPPQQPAVID